MIPIKIPQDTIRLSLQLGLMMYESQMVIAMRLWGMAGLWNVTPEENQRMVSEKADAMLASGLAVQKALISGAHPTRAALAGVRPLRRKTRANAKRLSGRGPKAGF